MTDRDEPTTGHPNEERCRDFTLLESLFASLDDALFIVDPCTRIVLRCNAAVERIFGYRAEEVVGRNTEFLHVDHEAYVRFGEELFSALDANGVFRTEFRMQRSNGEVFVSEHTVTQILDSSGCRIGVVSLVRDITEQRRMKDTIQRQLAEITSYYENAPIGLAVLDAELRYVRVNRRLAEINGIPAAAHIGKTVNEILPTLGTQALEVSQEIARTGCPVQDIEFSGEIPSEPGVRRVWWEGWFPIWGKNREVTGFTVIVQDITERKLAEERLVAGEEKCRSLFMAMHEGVALHELIYDDEGLAVDFVITDINPAYEQHTGLTREQIVDKRASELFGEPPFLEKYASVAETGQQIFFEEYFPPLNKYFSISAFSRAKGTFITVFRDVTMRKRIERAEAMHRGILEFLADFDQEITHMSLDRVIRRAVSFIRTRLRIPHVSLALLAEDHSGFHIKELQADSKALWPGKLLPMESTVLSEVIESDRPRYRSDIRRQTTHFEVDDWLLAEDIKSDFLVPLIVENQRIGTLNCASTEVDGISAGDRKMLARLAPRLGSALRNAQLFESLRETEERIRFLADVLERSSQPFGVGYQDGRLGVVNRAFCELLGRSQEELASLNWSLDLTPPEWRTREMQYLQELYRTGQPVRYEKEYIRKDGSRCPIELFAHLVRDDAGAPKYYYAFVTDITERKRAEEKLAQSRDELRLLALRLAELQEAERRLISRELHDQVGQMISVIGMNLNLVRALLPKEISDQVIERLDEATDNVEEVGQRIRDVTEDLRPLVLDDYGLLPALQAYANRFTHRTGIPVELLGDPEGARANGDLETALFRIAQEALTNIGKHANASKVTIRFEAMEKGVRMSVSDDGRGFDTSAAKDLTAQCGGLGLISMRERAVAVGATCLVESQLGRGTRVVVKWQGERHGR